MKKLMIPVAGLVCGLSLLVAPAAHAQGDIETLWQPSQPAIERVDDGDAASASAAVGELFNGMLCGTDSKNHYFFGQKQGQYLKKIVDIPPTQVKNHAPNTIYLWGQVKQGYLKGAQVGGLFTQKSPTQIDAKLRIKKAAPYQTDVTVHYQMKLIYQKPHDDKKWDKGGTPDKCDKCDKGGKGDKGDKKAPGTDPQPPTGDPQPPTGDPEPPTDGDNGGTNPVEDPGTGAGNEEGGDFVPLPGE